jgi:myosin heavy subunit
LKKVLTTRTTETPRGEKMTTPLTIDQSLDCRDAISKILYSNLFTWLVQRVNRIVHNSNGGSNSVSLDKSQRHQRTCINILDIFG